MIKREFGGLGIGSLNTINVSLLLKWWWRFKVENKSHWVKIMKSLYGVSGGLDLITNNKRSGTWAGILKTGWDLCNKGITMSSFLKVDVGNGANTNFWNDQWPGNNSIMASFPRLFRRFACSGTWISQMGSWRNSSWSWEFGQSCRLSGRIEEEYKELLAALGTVSLQESRCDRWYWSETKDCWYSVKWMRQFLDEKPNLSKFNHLLFGQT